MRTLMIGIAVPALAACGGSADHDQAGESSGVVSLQPGRWEVVSEVVDVTPAPPEQEAGMVGQREDKVVCLLPERAQRADLEVLIPWSAEGMTCTSSISPQGGRLRGSSTCTFADSPIRVAGTYEGEFDSQNYALRGRLESNDSSAVTGEGGASIIETRWTGRRTGECKGNEDSIPDRE